MGVGCNNCATAGEGFPSKVVAARLQRSVRALGRSPGVKQLCSARGELPQQKC